MKVDCFGFSAFSVFYFNSVCYNSSNGKKIMRFKTKREVTTDNLRILFHPMRITDGKELGVSDAICQAKVRV